MPQAEPVLKVKIGFVPVHREVFDRRWAATMRKRCLKALSKIRSLEIIVPDEKLTNDGLVANEDDAEKAINLFKEKDVAGIIIGTMTFGEELPVLDIAEAFADSPFLLFGTKEGSFTSDGNRLSDSFCGTLSVSSGLYRRAIPFLFAGILFPEEEAFKNTVTNFVRVCAIVKGFTGARIGQVGPRPEPFETCTFNESAMIQQFKQKLVPASLADIFESANRLSDKDPEVQKILKEIRTQADVSKMGDKSLIKIAKLECALKRFAQEKKIAAMTVQCWTAMQDVYGVCSCAAMGRLTDQGILTSCEVDVYGALTMLVQYLASLKATPPHFIDWTIQHQEKENVFLAWHCGNAPPSLACKGCAPTFRTHSILGRTLDPEVSKGTAEFQLRLGVVTLCRLVEYDGMFKMLITKGEIIQSQENLRGSWSWVKVPNLADLYRVLVEEGFIHHASMIHGDYTDAIADACKFLGIETVIV